MILVVIGLLLLSAAPIWAAEPTEQKMSITANPVGLIFGIANVQFAYKLNDNMALSIRGSYWGRTIGDWKWSSFGFGGAFQYFPMKSSLRGLYVGPDASVVFMSAEYDDDKDNTTFFGVGAEVGYRFVWKSGFTLDLSTGIQYLIGKLEIGDEEFPYGGFGWAGIGLGLGYSF